MTEKPTRPIAIAASIIVAVLVILVLVMIDRVAFRAPAWQVPVDISLDSHYEQLQHHQIEHAIWIFAQQKEGFEWNLRSEMYIFWVTILIAISGVAFAFWQFARAEQFDRAAAEADEFAVKTQMASLSFRSRSMASLVMFISIVYLGIYATLIHPLKTQATGAQVEAPLPASLQDAPPGSILELDGLFSDPPADMGFDVTDPDDPLPPEESD
jgi:hypothetical protein